MCGIAGILNLREERADKSLVAEMIQTVRHRGPDASGIYCDRNVALGHARLSIIDLACGQQPMQNADHSLCITFNGEIFNYLELRQELIQKGYRFATHSDTEVILHLYEEHGEDCVRFMNGQWAFAIWDANRRQLFLSRDRLGIRPLFYTRTHDAFLFGSEIKSLLACPDVRREIDLDALDEIFTFWFALPPRTIFDGISALPPGHSMRVKDGDIHVWQYWELMFPDGATCDEQIGDREDEWSEQLLALLTDATRIRLRSDVPVGAYLSGGLDSSVVTALAKQVSNTHLKTFSVAFDDGEFDESSYQREVTRFLGTEHQEIRCTYDDLGRIFPEVIKHTETPILRTAPAPLFMLSKLVHSNGYKVVLTGEGSDEMLGGYDIFKEAKIRRFLAAQPDSQIRPLLLKKLYPYLQNLQAQSGVYLKEFFRVSGDDISSPFFSHLPRWGLTSRLKLFFSDAVRSELDTRNRYDDLESRLPAQFSTWDRFCQAQYLEAMYLLPNYILSSQGDRVAMAHSVEVRLPFLDYRVAEFAARIPSRLKMKVLNEKYILKKCASALIPPSVTRRPKQPYRAPDGKVFFAGESFDYVEELLSSSSIQRGGIFNPLAVQKLSEKFKNGRAIGIKDNMALVGILSTQLVLHHFVNNPVRTPLYAFN